MKTKRTFTIYVVLLVLALACQTSTAILTPTPLFTTSPVPTSTLTITPAPTLTLTPIPTITQTPRPAIKRVIILSIDGLRPDAIALAPMPNLMALMQNGAYSLSAQTVFPSVTLTSHSSMLTGLCPAKHGVDWNDYIPERGYAFGTDLFDIAHAAGLQTVMYVGKEKIRQVTEPASLDTFVFVNDRDLVLMERLIADFPQNFGVLFIHFPLVDGMGHVYGWLSSQQLSVAFRADEALGGLLAELDARNLRNETLIIISADHGGHDTTHGSSLPEDMTIPWIASGPGIVAGELLTHGHTMDTAATAAYALGLTIPPEWDGRPVVEAFGLPVIESSQQCQ